jgi:DNA-directed RNA polymerase specialized sigma24 family protein
MVAMVLGTALSALGPATGLASETRETTVRTVNDLSRYCTTCWRNAHLNPSCWNDCTQEVLSRLLERVTPHAWSRVLQDEGDERREFLRAIDTVKKRSQRSRKWSSAAIETAPDRHAGRERALAEDRETVRQAAEELLTPRQQRILQMCLDGWQVHDIARELRTGAERVSDEKYKAICKLRSHLSSAEN